MMSAQVKIIQCSINIELSVSLIAKHLDVTPEQVAEMWNDESLTEQLEASLAHPLAITEFMVIGGRYDIELGNGLVY